MTSNSTLNLLRLDGPAPKKGFRGHGTDDGATVKAPAWLMAVVKGDPIIASDDSEAESDPAEDAPAGGEEPDAK